MGRYDDGDGSTFLAGLLVVCGVGLALAIGRGAKAITGRCGDLGLVGVWGLLLTVALSSVTYSNAGVGLALLVVGVGVALSGAFFVLGARARQADLDKLWAKVR